MKRRSALKLIGGGVVVAATSSCAIVNPSPQAALAPWDKAGDYEDVRKWALSYALLAPNAHNRQPWLVELKDDDTIILWRDTSRELPETDPFHRQLVISLGCFLEQMKIAASQKGVGVDMQIYPDGEDGPVAIASFNASADPDPLFSFVMQRRSAKEPFASTALLVEHAEVLSKYATVYSDKITVDKLKELTWQAWLTEAYHAPANAESVELIRMGKQEINASPDGIELRGRFIECLIFAGILTRDSLLDTNSDSFKRGESRYKDILSSSKAYAVLTTKGNTRHDQVDAGRRWLRLNLAATQLGVALHPVSQSLQEYPEMAVHYNNAHNLLAGSGETVQMLGRVGYGPIILRTPRWPLETRLI